MPFPRVALSLAVFFLAAQLTAGDAAACENPGKTHKLKFEVKGNQCVEKVKKENDDEDAETISVCVTDIVRWKVSGPAKAIVFEGDTPFDWPESGFQGKHIEGTIKPGTEGKTFKYSVKVEGLECVHDPRIVVDR